MVHMKTVDEIKKDSTSIWATSDLMANFTFFGYFIFSIRDLGHIVRHECILG